jgi:hypothetical protein
MLCAKWLPEGERAFAGVRMESEARSAGGELLDCR